MDLLPLAVLAARAVAAPLDAAPLPPAVAVSAPAPGPVRLDRIRGGSRSLPQPSAAVPPSAPLVASDTLFEYSEAYYKRLDIHRAGSYAMLPLFVFQYLAGTQLYDKSFEAPGWAKTGHRVAATGVAVLFTVNTVTGVMNLYEGRTDPDERGRKVFHAVMMMAADAGFLATGLLAERAESSGDDRDLHRSVALGSVGVATVGYLAMLDVFRRD